MVPLRPDASAAVGSARAHREAIEPEDAQTWAPSWD